MKIKDDVANVLVNSTVDGNKLYLPNEQLGRKLYLAVNKVLTAIKGKWDRKAKAHIFPECPAEVIESILLTGEYTDKKKEFQFFETPDLIARKLVDMAEITDNETVCEPSAGKGKIASLLPKSQTTCFELDPENREYLEKKGYKVAGANFLQNKGRFDVFVANPPFSKQQDIDHVNHMLDLANRRVVSVMSASVLFRTNKKTVLFRGRIEALNGTFELLPDDSFKESGTRVKACIVCVDV